MLITRTKLLRSLAAVAVLGLLGLSVPAPAHAALTIQLSIVVTDASNTILANPTVVTQTGGAFPSQAVITTASGTNFSGILLSGISGGAHNASDPNTPPLNNTPTALLNSIVDQLTNISGATRIAHVVVSATGFTQPVPGFASVNLAGRWLNATGSSIAAQWYENPTNQLATVTGTAGGTWTAANFQANGSNQLASIGPANSNNNFFTSTSTDLQAFSYQQIITGLPNTTPYGLTLKFDLTLTAGANLQNRSQAINVAAVPEPATLGAALFGMLGVAFVARRRRV